VTLVISCVSLVGVAITALVVLSSEGGGGGSNDGTGWAWLDVVRIGVLRGGYSTAAKY
jgi:hypothetical protein